MHPALRPVPALPLFAPTDARAAGDPAAAGEPVAEIVTFRLTPDSDETAFLAAARATAAAVAAQPGFLRRVLSRDDGGLWTDHVEWDDRASAETAARAVTALPEFRPFVGFIDLAVMNMRHARVLWSMSN